MAHGKDAAWLIVGLLVGLSIHDSFSKPVSDEQKWAAFEKNREVRRINERRYEACTTQCMKGCAK